MFTTSRVQRVISILFILALLLSSVHAPAVSAESTARPPALTVGNWYVATTGNDANDCATPTTPCATINGAIGKAVAGDAILVATGTYTGLEASVVFLGEGMTLSGGWDTTFSSQNDYSTIDGQHARRGVFVSTDIGISASLDHFIVRNGYSFNDAGAGVISLLGNLTISHSSIQNNSASRYGGGIYHSGGILTLKDTTLSNNSASAGGGFYLNHGSVTLNNATLSNNSASASGGGFYLNLGYQTPTSITFSNSILGGNTAPSDPDCHAHTHTDTYASKITSDGNNIVSNTSGCTFTAAGGDQLNINPKLGTFLPVPGYHPLLSSSPAIDAGNPDTCLPTDQRGAARVGTCDIGAYEYTAPGPATRLSIASGNDQHAPPLQAFTRPLQVVALDSQGSPVPNVNVTFTAPASGASSTFADSGTNTTSALTDEGGIATASITANAQIGAYQVSASASDLTSTNFDLQNIGQLPDNEHRYVATTGNDANDCVTPQTPCATINEAIGKAAAGNTILVAAGTYTDSSGSEVVLVFKSVSLSGGWDATFSFQQGYSAIDGQNVRRGVYVNSIGVIASLDHFIVKNGSSNDGGGINNYGTLTIANSSIQNNSASNGGGIYNSSGNLTLKDTTISHNSASSGSGGGIYQWGNGSLTLKSTTISSNFAFSSGGGIYAPAGAAAGSLSNSILGENIALLSGPDCAGSFTSSGNNLISNTSGCTVTAASGDQLDVDPMLGTFLPEPGYHPLLSISPAIDAGNPATCLSTDQRGLARVGTCDIGAYEFAAPGPAVHLSIVSGNTQRTPILQMFSQPLQAVTLDSLGSPVPNVTVTFTAPAAGASGTFAASGTNTTSALTDAGGVATTSPFTANAEFGAYQVSASASDLAPIHFNLQNFEQLPDYGWYVATTGNDANDCATPSTPCATIKGAIGKAQGGGTIIVATGTYTGSGAEVVYMNKSVTLSGGWDATFSSQNDYSTIDGQNARQGIFVYFGLIVSLDHFIVKNGSSYYGGGVHNAGDLTITHSSIQNNSATNGGGIYNYGYLTVNNSTLSNNSASGGGTYKNDGSGGGIYNVSDPLNGGGNSTLKDTTLNNNSASKYGGGIFNDSGDLALNNSTISNNSAPRGGGIYNGTLNTVGNLALNNSTISNNAASADGGGIYQNFGDLKLKNTTVSNNSASRGGGIYTSNATISSSILGENTALTSGPDCYISTSSGKLTSTGNNLISNMSGCTITAIPGVGGDQLDVDPMLGPLADNGGPTQTMALLEGSPAIDAGNPNTCLPTDQRGVTRAGICDIGAYEYSVPVVPGSPDSLSIVSGNDQSAPPLWAFARPLQVLALDSQSNPASNVLVTFTAPASGASGTFTDSGTNTTSALTDANGIATTSTFTANAEFGAYQVSASASGLTSTHFDLQNGAWYVSPAGDDVNFCSLPAAPCLTINGAINKAAWGGTILITAGTYTGSGTEVVLVNKSLTLSGGWDATFSSQHDYATIDGQNTRSGVKVYGGVIASLDRFIVKNGYSWIAGGVYNGGNLTITHSSIQNNAGRAAGGGIYNYYNGGSYDYYGSLTLKDTTLNNNSASGSGSSTGGAGGGIYNSGNLTLNNTTLSNNSASANGVAGGVGGGIFTYGPAASISNSILGENTASSSGPDCWGTFTSSGNNLIGNTSGCTIPEAGGDQLDVDPMLGAFLPEQGYQPLRPDSPAIDAGNPDTCLPTDQRGVARVGICDIGAYEYTVPGPAARLSVVSGNAQTTPPLQAFTRPLQVVALDNQGSPVPNVNVTFIAPASGASGTFLASGTNTTSVVTNEGGVAMTSTFTANAEVGVYQVSASAGNLASIPFDLQNGAWFVSPTGDDANSCSLPAAPCLTINGTINKAASGDIILIATGTYFGSSSPVVLVNKNLTLSGGWDATFSSQNDYATLDGENARQGIEVGAVTASVDHFIIRNGRINYSAGGVRNGGNLTITYSSIQNNSGGGIYNIGNLTITHSSIQNNSGPGIYNDHGNLALKDTTIHNNFTAGSGGGIYQLYGNLVLNNTTIHNNSAGWDGGGISQFRGSLALNNSTISNNSASRGGGIETYGPTGSISNSIVAGNTARTSDPDCFTDHGDSAITSRGNNIISTSSGCTIIATGGDRFNVDPKLGTFLPEQGYQPLRPDSPAIDAGNPATCLPTDQRGVARPQGPRCDIGAYEYKVPGPAARLSVVGGNDQHTAPLLAFAKPLQVVALDSQGSPVTNVTVTFTAPASGASGSFTDSSTNTTSALTDADGIATASTFTANAEFGAYQVSASGSGLTSTHFDLANLAWYVSPTGNDANSCSLPAAPCLTINGAIAKAASGDLILIATGTYTGSGAEVVLVNKSLTLSGGWDAAFSSQHDYAIIDGQHARRGVSVSSSDYITRQPVIASLDRFLIRNGSTEMSGGSHTADGGGVNNAGDLTITNSFIQNNSASSGGGVYTVWYLTISHSYIQNNSASEGGGIHAGGSLTLKDTTISNNSADDGGGIYNSGDAALNNTTLSHNSASKYGGGIFNNDSNLTLNNTTISNNSASISGGGIYAYGPGGIISNSILAGNTARTSGPDCYAYMIGSGGHNVISNISSCAIPVVPGDRFNVDPKLGAFLPVPGYQPLRSDSPAIDAGNPATCLPTDQRGVARVGICDIGAYEYTLPGPAARLFIVSGDGQQTLLNHAFSEPLRVVAVDSQGSPVPNLSLTFTAPGNGPSGRFASTGTNTASVLSDIDGIATASIFTANDQTGSYTLIASANGAGSVEFHLQNGAWYVAPTGDDANSCFLPAAPCATVNGAIKKATAMAGGTIFVATGTYTGPGSEEVVLLTDNIKNITLSGGWNPAFTLQNGTSIIDGQGARRGITVSYGVSAVIDHFVIQNGRRMFAGGILNSENATLTVDHTTIRYNTALTECFDGEPGWCIPGGGAIENTGTLTVNNSTISNNISLIGNYYGAGAGGIHNLGMLILNNSTVSGNTGGEAGGLKNEEVLIVNNSTISSNQPYGISSPESSATLENTILAGNSTNGDCYGWIFTQGYNLIGSKPAGCALLPSTGDLVGTTASPINPRLTPLQDNGGPTFTHALLTGSPAIDAGNPATCLPTDQRGLARMGICDIGAYELNGVPTTISISGDAGVSGAILSYFDGTQKTVTADGSGNYTITVPSGWSGTVTPSLSGMTFDPANRSYSNVTANQANQNYSAFVTLSGNTGTAGVTMSYVDGTSKTITADGSGNYSITVPWGWTGTVTPSLASDAFCPASQSYNNLRTSRPMQNYAHMSCPTFGTIGKWTSSFDLSHGWTVSGFVRTVGDVSGDGQADLVGFGLDGVYVAVSNGTGFNAISKWTSAFDLSHGWTGSQFVRTVGDVDGDGDADLVGFGLDGVYVGLSDGSRFATPTKWIARLDNSHGWTVSNHVRTVGDVNGDGMADLVAFGQDGVYVSLSDGSRFADPTRWTDRFANQYGWTVSNHVRTVGDVNGDGMADIIGFGLDGVYVATSNGSGFNAINRWTASFALANGWTVSDFVRTVGDVNGDGMADVVGFGLDGVYIGLSTGSAFSLPSRRTTSFDLAHGWTVSGFVRTVGDVNGGGKADLVGFGLDGVYIALAQ